MGSLEARVTRLQPRVQPFEAAVDLYFDGQFAACLGVLEHHGTVDAFALGARALLRLNRPADALEAVRIAFETFEESDQLSRSQRGEFLMHRANAHLRLDPLSDAMHDAFMTARVAVYCAANSALEAEFTFLEAYAGVVTRDFDAVVSHCERVLDVAPLLGEGSYVIPLAQSRARAADALAFVAARNEAYGEQRRFARQALDECAAGGRRDAMLEANLLWNLAVFAQDFGDEDGTVRRRYESMAWTDALATQRYEVLRALAWAQALAGNTLAAFRDLREATEIAPTIPRKIRAILDRAYFSNELHQSFSAREEIDYAERLAARTDWNDAARDDADLSALSNLALMLAPIAPDRARRFYERYRSLRPKLSADRLASIDRRPRAEELATEAALALADGNRGRAAELYRDAFAIWDALGYGVRAAVVARELAALGEGPQFSAYAAAETARRPQSLFALAPVSAGAAT